MQDAARLRQWLAQMRREHWVPTRHQHLCSEHFEPSCFEYRWGVRYLRPDAVPTIFPDPGTPPTVPEEPFGVFGTPPRAGGGELSAAELLGVVLLLQRKVRGLQQRHRRHRARLEAMEGLIPKLRPPGTTPLIQEVGGGGRQEGG
uniref:THAP-type domain-containing protein n=1 Tax=Anas zonorhyncha TaxID=75864 RepID=A0A8B9W040_9AVES